MELEIFKKEDLSLFESQFVELHSKIITNARMSGAYLYEFCKQLLEMRESKAYQVAGLKNFEEYATEVLGLKKSQAYNFCSIAENVKPEIFNLVGNNASSTKLLLISKLEPEEQEKVIETVDLSTTKVKELEILVDSLKTENNTLKNCNDVLQKENEEKDALKDKIQELEKKLAETKKKHLQSNDNSNDEKRKIKELEEELEKLRNQEPEIIEKEVIKEVIKQDPLQEKRIKELEDELKKKEIMSNDSISKFKVIFETIKREIMLAKDMISTFNDEDASKCNCVLKKLIEMV